MWEGFGDQSVAKRLFKFELFFYFSFFFSFFCLFFFFFYIKLHCLAICHKLVPFCRVQVTKSTYCKNTVISHIGKTFCSVLSTFSIEFFFRVDLKHFASHMV